ncbi:MAG: M48 family metalloprotease [Thermoplasmatales archaeon]|nr:M48 family metalloprotease [Candidatus Thermoplasmatota archaeon]MCL6002574.1 M48 family metalloprotease [Candidatus Thermoplasmatota archaeon]MDA8055643.1 M48 family metalloprotease [Thermoplasmatales archaeon]
MKDKEEAENVSFWRKRATISLTTWLIVLLSSIAFYFSTGSRNYFADVVLQTVFLIPLLVISSYLEYSIDLKYKRVKIGYVRYVRNSFSYLYLATPFWIMSAAVILSSGNPYLAFLCLDIIFLLAIIAMIVNVRVRILKRASKEIENTSIVQRAKGIAERMGIKIFSFRVVDWSKAKIANAFQAGLSNYYVFVTNFLLENLTDDESLAIIAHEIAHAQRKHLKKTLTFATIAMISIGNILFATLVLKLGVEIRTGFVMGIVFSIFLTLYVILPFIQRRFEREADMIAAQFTGPTLLADSLMKVARLNHSPINIPSYLNLSHPSTSERVDYLKELENSKKT